jgi:hypothetical protein
MKSIWVDEGKAADFDKGQKYEISSYYFALFDNELKDKLNEAKSKGFTAGVYMAGNWPQFDGKTGKAIAVIVNDRVQAIMETPILNRSHPKVQFDIESHDPLKIINCFQQWRMLRPNHDTSWTMEPMQGGWMGPKVNSATPPSYFVQEIIKLGIRVVPQYYGGPTQANPQDMQPFAPDMVFRDLLDRGFPSGLISGFYDAAILAHYWDGFAFTQQRLP